MISSTQERDDVLVSAGLSVCLSVWVIDNRLCSLIDSYWDYAESYGRILVKFWKGQVFVGTRNTWLHFELI